MAHVWPQVKSFTICDGESGTGTEFLQALQSPLPILIPPDGGYSSTGASTSTPNPAESC
jgi:hypothetical protein